jgi:hypothetical protein
MVINGLAARGRRDTGIWILVVPETYGRPGQVLASTHGQVHPPSPVRGLWTIVFNPEEAGIASQGAPAERIWFFDYLELLHHFRAVCEELGIHLVSYQTRHASAPRDAVKTRRTRAEIRKRGSWRSAKSVNHYEKSGRLPTARDSLVPALQHHALRCEAGSWETVTYSRVTAT